MTPDASGTVAQRSAFVTGLAWTFIVLGALATLMAVLQNIMLVLMFPREEFVAAMQEVETDPSMPAFFRFMFGSFHLFFLGFLVLSAATLVSAIGLLRRWNWARLVFIGIMAVGALWNLSSLAMPFVMGSMMPELAGHAAPPDFYDNFQLMWNIMIGFTIVMGLGFAALFAWIIKRLMAEDVRREFRRPSG